MSALRSQKLLEDKRVLEAKRLLKEALIDMQQNFYFQNSPDEDLQVAYDQTISDFSKLRGLPLFFPFIGSGFGKGPLVELANGSVKYDFITGIGPHCFGHNSLDLLDSSIDAALSDTIMQGNLQQNSDSYLLSKLLVEASSLDHCFLSTTGVMANENALKLSFQKKYPATRLLAFEHCFFGRSLIASQVTDKPAYRENLPINYHIDYIPFYDEKNEDALQNSLHILKQHLKRYPNQHAAMIFELIQGEGGFYTAPKEFFVALMKVLKEANITIIIDEVQSFGRTSKLFTFQHFELEEYVDIVTIGKLSQVCATLYKKEYVPKPGLLSQTFTGSTSAIKAGFTIIKELLNNNYFGPNGKNMRLHQMMVDQLKTLQNCHPDLIEGPFGVGAMIAFTPFKGDAKKVVDFIKKLFDNGVMAFAAGSDPTRVRFLISFGNIDEHAILEVMNIVEKTLLM